MVYLKCVFIDTEAAFSAKEHSIPEIGFSVADDAHSFHEQLQWKKVDICQALIDTNSTFSCPFGKMFVKIPFP